MSSSFSKFTVPEKGEGFDEIKYEWLTSEAKCSDFMKDWISTRKLTSRIEDITPSPWFQQKQREFQSIVNNWQFKVKTYRSKIQKKAADKAEKAARKKAKEIAAANAKAKKELEEKLKTEKKENEENKEGEEKAEGEEKKEEETKKELEEKLKAEKKENE